MTSMIREALIRSYQWDIADLEKDIKKHGNSPAAERTLNRLRAKLKALQPKDPQKPNGKDK